MDSDYFFNEQNNFTLCVICKENVAILIQYNTPTNVDTKYVSTFYNVVKHGIYVTKVLIFFNIIPIFT